MSVLTAGSHKRLAVAAVALGVVAAVVCGTSAEKNGQAADTAEERDLPRAAETAVPSSGTPAMGEAFADIMGHSGYIAMERGAGDWSLRTYYAVSGGGLRNIAETFGFGAPQDYSVDLEDDGVTELVANVQFGGDGARRAYVYQRRGEDIYLGTLSAVGLPNFDDWGANATWSEYDPETGVFRLHYAQKNTEEYAVLETRDLGRFAFQEFVPLT